MASTEMARRWGRGRGASPVRDDVVQEEHAAKRHLAGHHVPLHVNAQLPCGILLIHLHIPASSGAPSQQAHPSSEAICGHD